MFKEQIYTCLSINKCTPNNICEIWRVMCQKIVHQINMLSLSYPFKIDKKTMDRKAKLRAAGFLWKKKISPIYRLKIARIVTSNVFCRGRSFEYNPDCFNLSPFYSFGHYLDFDRNLLFSNVDEDASALTKHTGL